MGVVLWEALTSQRLFRGSNEADTIRRITTEAAPPLSSRRADLAPLDGVTARALAPTGHAATGPAGNPAPFRPETGPGGRTFRRLRCLGGGGPGGW